MVLVGLKQFESFFKPLWCVVFSYNLVGATFFVLGALEIAKPGWWPTLVFETISEDAWKIMGLAFFLFPVGLLISIVRFPFRLVSWKRERKVESA